MKVLVTGAAGFIGYRAAAALLALGNLDDYCAQALGRKAVVDLQPGQDGDVKEGGVRRRCS